MHNRIESKYHAIIGVSHISLKQGVGEELQHEIPALEDHPAGVPENDSEAQPFIEGGGGIEIS